MFKKVTIGLALLLILLSLVRIYASFPVYPLIQALEKGTIQEHVDQVVVNEVKPNSPAEQAGFKAGDIIIAIDQSAVFTAEQVIQRSTQKAGTAMEFMVVRNGDHMTLQVTPRENPSPREGRLGLVLTNFVEKKISTPELVSKVIFEHYNGTAPEPMLLFMFTFNRNRYEDVFLLIEGLIMILLSIFLILQKKWALIIGMVAAPIFIVYMLVMPVFKLGGMSPLNFLTCLILIPLSIHLYTHRTLFMKGKV
jgi:membrane-associated protease RseP (regulator of RpoE activity)